MTRWVRFEDGHGRVGFGTLEADAVAEYAGERLTRVAFPMGGMGAGMICLEGTGARSHFSLRNRPEVFNEPLTFAALSIKGESNAALVLEGPVPSWKIFGAPGTGNGGRVKTAAHPWQVSTRAAASSQRCARAVGRAA